MTDQMLMNIDQIFADSERFAEEVESVLPEPCATPANRVSVSRVACSLALEHWDATKILLSTRLLPSAVVVHRAQFEAIVRSIWMLYAASDAEFGRLAVSLSKEAEQAAKNIAGLQEMIADIEKRGPAEAFNALARFRDNALKPINSYVHSGIHPLHRHARGYPDELIAGVLRNSNGVAILSWMQAVVLEDRQDLQSVILKIADRYPACLPAPI